MLYYPWYDEKRDLLGSYSTYEEHYRHVYDNRLMLADILKLRT